MYSIKILYKELLQFNIKIMNNQLDNKKRFQIDISMKESPINMKRCSRSLASRKLQIKTLVKVHFTSIRMAIICSLSTDYIVLVDSRELGSYQEPWVFSPLAKGKSLLWLQVSTFVPTTAYAVRSVLLPKGKQEGMPLRSHLFIKPVEGSSVIGNGNRRGSKIRQITL